MGVQGLLASPVPVPVSAAYIKAIRDIDAVPGVAQRTGPPPAVLTVQPRLSSCGFDFALLL